MTGRTLLVGYDGSAPSRAAVEWAASEAELRHTTLLVVTCGYVSSWSTYGYVTYVEPTVDELREASEADLAEVAGRLRETHPAVDVQTRFVPGHPPTTLLDLMEHRTDIEMAVLGSRGHGGFTELLVGSTSLQVAAHAPCPVVVLRGRPDDDRTGSEAGRVVVGLDGSPLSEGALSFAFEEASLRGCGLTAVHAWQTPFFDAPGRAPLPAGYAVEQFGDEERRAVAELLAGWADKFPDVDVRSLVLHEGPVAALVEASRGARLLVVGSRGRGGFRSLVMGSVSHGCLHHATCPVAVVHTRALALR